MKSVLFWPSTPPQPPCSVRISGPTIASVTAHRPLSFSRKWALRTYSPPSTYISTMSDLLTPYIHLHLGCWAARSNRTRVARTRWGASTDQVRSQLQADCSPVCWLQCIYALRPQKSQCHIRSQSHPQGSTPAPKHRVGSVQGHRIPGKGKDSNEERRWAQGKGIRDFPIAQMVKNLSAMQKTWVRFLDQEDPLEKEMATHFSILAWRIPWTEEPGRLQSMEYMTKQITNTHTQCQLTSRSLMESCKSDRAT